MVDMKSVYSIESYCSSLMQLKPSSLTLEQGQGNISYLLANVMEKNVVHACNFKPDVSGFLLAAEDEDFEMHHFGRSMSFLLALELHVHQHVYFDGDMVAVDETGVQLVNVLGVDEGQQFSSFFVVLDGTLDGLHFILLFELINYNYLLFNFKKGTQIKKTSLCSALKLRLGAESPAFYGSERVLRRIVGASRGQLSLVHPQLIGLADHRGFIDLRNQRRVFLLQNLTNFVQLLPALRKLERNHAVLVGDVFVDLFFIAELELEGQKVGLLKFKNLKESYGRGRVRVYDQHAAVVLLVVDTVGYQFDDHSFEVREFALEALLLL